MRPTVRSVLKARGGMVPRERTRARRVLSLAEREGISRGLCQGHSLRQIAKELKRAVSTVSREVNRHGGRWAYRAESADRRAWNNARRPKECVLARQSVLQRAVARKLEQNWSPRQIAGWLKLKHPHDESMHVSHETIYRSLYVQTRGALKKELLEHLRTHRSMRRSKKAPGQKDRQDKTIVDAVPISQRPAEAEDRAVPGHWEGDLLSGRDNTHIATLVERHSRYAMLIKVDSKKTADVIKALSRHVRRLPADLRKSLTWDRGREMCGHKDFTIATDVKVYFCDPQSPWQRGSNENTNGLLRQYFPKGTDLSQHSQAHLNKVARQLNERPRETLGFLTPIEKLRETVASIG
jgi:IS30 family transposase